MQRNKYIYIHKHIHIIDKNVHAPTHIHKQQDRVVNCSGSDMVNFLLYRVQRVNTTKTGIILISFNSECGTAQLSLLLCVLYFCSSRYVAFVELIDLNDLLDDVTFPLSTNQKPRKNLHTDGRTTDGRTTDGRTTDGRTTDGRTDGRTTDGQKSDL